MQSRKYAIIEKKEGIAKVIINDPEKRNRFNREVMLDLISAYEEIRDDDSVAVVITTGAGVSWCAGMDAEHLLEIQERRAQHKRFDSPIHTLCELVRNFPKVTIAAVNGYCLGAGISFIIVHDLAIASEEQARFGLPEVMRGFPPGLVGSTLFRAIPMKWAFDMVLTGDNWDARTAQKAGLITRIVPDDKLQELAFQWAKEIARWNPLVLEYSKKMAHASMDEPSYLKTVETNRYLGVEQALLNPMSHQGLRDFLAKTGKPAKQMIKWV